MTKKQMAKLEQELISLLLNPTEDKYEVMNKILDMKEKGYKFTEVMYNNLVDNTKSVNNEQALIALQLNVGDTFKVRPTQTRKIKKNNISANIVRNDQDLLLKYAEEGNVSGVIDIIFNTESCITEETLIKILKSGKVEVINEILKIYHSVLKSVPYWFIHCKTHKDVAAYFR